MKSTMSDEMKADAAERGRSYMAAFQMIETIIEGLSLIEDAADEARAFYSSIRDRDYDFISERSYTVGEHAAYWEGFAYAVDIMAGYNASRIARELTEEQIAAIQDILDG